ncbi:energy transducer TonB [Corticibacter populi]|uniref:Energy transducer TonB n=1 Tax=Corticibacter populi TaxID=1550736 RepID=A0A3M6QM14_9BURK|nr:energy transducer TonB [Corticibacter populi]RMX04087.1 energy transducer TonB [Corticibacter populi]RZS33094.1 outer membrane transport energization protein TonB [Corticibacter populi]
MTPLPPLQQPNRLSNTSLAVGGALLIHVAALWAVVHVMNQETEPAEVIEPAVILTQLIAPPAPEPLAAPAAAPAVPEPPPPVPPPPPPPEPPPPAPKPPPPPKPTPKPVTKPKPVTERTPVVPPAPPPEPAPAPAPVEAPPAPTPAPAVASAPSSANITGTDARSGSTNLAEGEPVIQRAASNSSAALNNTPVPYPPISRRMREEGRVVLRVLVSANGTAKEVRIRTSSGYDRLDKAAQEAVLRNWRFTPTKRNGAPIDDWYDIPVNFKLT